MVAKLCLLLLPILLCKVAYDIFHVFMFLKLPFINVNKCILQNFENYFSRIILFWDFCTFGISDFRDFGLLGY